MNNKKVLITHSVIFKLFVVIATLAIIVILLVHFFYELMLPPQPELSEKHFIHLLLMYLVGLFFIIAFIFIHHILKPIKELSKAVKEIRSGNLNYSIKYKGKDELGRLAGAFNAMSADLKKMIQAREQLLLDVSHELRTPITRSKLALEMMPDSAEKLSVSDDLKEIELMITEILETARMDTGKVTVEFNKVSVKNLISNALAGFDKEKDMIKLNPVSENLYIKADESKLMIVLRNIIENAVKHTPPESKQIEITVIHETDKITVQVEDFGKGIPEDKLPFVFEPFYRADNSRSKKSAGYGLGLHLCKRIMEVHHAEITIQNKVTKDGIIVSLIFFKSN